RRHIGLVIIDAGERALEALQILLQLLVADITQRRIADKNLPRRVEIDEFRVARCEIFAEFADIARADAQRLGIAPRLIRPRLEAGHAARAILGEGGLAELAIIDAVDAGLHLPANHRGQLLG